MSKMIIEQRIKELGLILPEVAEPKGSYANCVRTGNLLFVSGKGPVAGLPEIPIGKIGEAFTVVQGYSFAKVTGLNILAAVERELGSLGRVSQVIKLQGFINAVDSFEQHPEVLDGCSDLMLEIFGEKGVHARSVFGVKSLRGNLPIAIDSIFEFSEG